MERNAGPHATTGVDRWRSLKNDHLVDLRRDTEFEITMLGHSRGMWDEPEDPAERARLEQLVEDVNTELARRGFAEDGYTIIDEAACDRWDQERRGHDEGSRRQAPPCS